MACRGFICPAPIDSALARQLQELAIKAHLAIGTEDVSRVDMRMDAEGNPRLLEINTLPGLTPEFSDLCVIANADGLSYQDLILEILYLGASRWKLFPARPVEIPRWKKWKWPGCHLLESRLRPEVAKSNLRFYLNPERV